MYDLTLSITSPPPGLCTGLGRLTVAGDVLSLDLNLDVAVDVLTVLGQTLVILLLRRGGRVRPGVDGLELDVKDAVSVAEDCRDRDLAWSVLLVSQRPALPEEDLAGVLEDVAGAEPGHGDDSLAALGGAGEVVLAGGGTGSSSLDMFIRPASLSSFTWAR